ncbi:MAG: hypothetical protein GY854_19055 [Deltaproteobacteria bacterium]|nr:hypothetical protein [Deltaproteobacteria bacterium]
MKSLVAVQQISLRKMSKRFMSHVEAKQVRRVLVTSVDQSDGKRTFVDLLANEFAVQGEKPFLRLEHRNLLGIDPDFGNQQLVVIQGPSFFDENGLSDLPEKWLRAIDATVVMVTARKTKAKDLAMLVDWLKEYGIENIWPVWNEKQAPPMDTIWMRLKSRWEKSGKKGNLRKTPKLKRTKSP